MTQNDFTKRRQAAIDTMRQMNERSVYKNREEKPHTPPPEPTKKQPPPQSGLNIPVLKDFFKDSDSALIIGLLLILLNEKCDKTLLFALVYILI